MPQYASWSEKRAAESWHFRWAMRWLRLRYRLFEVPWMWLRNELVWDFNTYPDGRLMRYRTREFLAEDDPRHFED